MQVEVHWQDADSSSNVVSEVFLTAKIMTCGGHAGRAHKNLLEVRAKQESFTNAFIARYEKQYPEVRTLTCHCRGKHKAGCGCLSVSFIGKALTNTGSTTCPLVNWAESNRTTCIQNKSHGLLSSR